MNYHKAEKDNNFLPPGSPLPADFIDPTNFSGQDREKMLEQRSGLDTKADQYAQQGMANNGMQNPATDAVPMAMNPNLVKSPDLSLVPDTIGETASAQRRGFNTRQARVDFTMGVVANSHLEPLEGARVYVETPSTKIAGSILAVGDQEFAVVWDDKTASVERKGDYELVFKN